MVDRKDAILFFGKMVTILVEKLVFKNQLL